MPILFFEEKLKVKDLKRLLIRNWIQQIVALEGKLVGEINFIFCSDEYLLEVNRKHLAHDYFTDVITFDYVEKDCISGDVFISWDRVKENANKLQVSPFEELCRICAHGVLHLCGYKDKSPAHKKEMTDKENFYLSIR